MSVRLRGLYTWVPSQKSVPLGMGCGSKLGPKNPRPGWNGLAFWLSLCIKCFAPTCKISAMLLVSSVHSLGWDRMGWDSLGWNGILWDATGRRCKATLRASPPAWQNAVDLELANC